MSPPRLSLITGFLLFLTGSAVAADDAQIRAALFSEDFERFAALYIQTDNKNTTLDEDGNTVSFLRFSLLVRDPRFFELVVESADPNVPGIGDMTALFDMPMHCDLARAQMLLERGGDVNYRSAESGLTPLHMVAVTECYELAEFLVAAGADRLAIDDSGVSPYQFANRENNARMEKLLRP